MRIYKCFSVSTGVAIGKAAVLDNRIQNGNTDKTIDKTEEKRKATVAIRDTCNELKSLTTVYSGEKLKTDMLNIQIELAQDPDLIGRITKYIKGNGFPAADAILKAAESIADEFEKLSNEYYRARAADIRDIGKRMALHAMGKKMESLTDLQEPCIIFCDDITPSETVTMNPDMVLAFVTKNGSQTSHAAILANALEIPAVVGLSASEIPSFSSAIVDGTSGTVIADPTPEEVEKYRQVQKKFQIRRKCLKNLKDMPAATVDNHHVKLCINIGSPKEAQLVQKMGCDGVGLFRTEFLYMDAAEMPTEEQQFNAYKAAAVNADNKPVIIRTLDIGGDKRLPYMELPKESNPFLGYRAIRICLDRKELFKCQLRAILRAGKFGNLRIMLPMIGSITELRCARKILKECMSELDVAQIDYARNIPVGIMIEIPSAAETADILAKEADFFSIGTNDLCQYALAVDRTNTKVAHLYNPLNPGVLRMIAKTIREAHKCGIKVGMCGEMASNLTTVPLLLGLGLDEFSVSASKSPCVKEKIRSVSYAKTQEAVKRVLQLDSENAIKTYLETTV